MATNPMSKGRKVEQPYLTLTSPDGWEWRVLKSYQSDNRKPYARWLCAVKSPFTYGGWDMGDTYVIEVVTNGTLVAADPSLDAAYIATLPIVRSAI